MSFRSRFALSSNIAVFELPTPLMTLATRLVGVNRFTTIRQTTVFHDALSKAPSPVGSSLNAWLLNYSDYLGITAATLLERLVKQKE